MKKILIVERAPVNKNSEGKKEITNYYS